MPWSSFFQFAIAILLGAWLHGSGRMNASPIPRISTIIEAVYERRRRKRAEAERFEYPDLKA